jgi:hypothetical protein
MKLFLPIVLVLASSIKLPAQEKLFVPRNIQKTYSSQTRNVNGEPGNRFWKNYAEYYIQVSFNPKNLKVEGKQIITYYNNSPDTLKKLVFRTAPDFYKKGNERNRIIAANDVTDGLEITDCAINAVKVEMNHPDVMRNGTITEIRTQPIKPFGGKTTVEMSWHYTLNRTSHERTRMIDEGSYFIAYFFPRIAVYDDIDGWDNFPYLGRQETYFDNAFFNVFITVPKNYMVWATGDLQNPTEVLQDHILKKWTLANFSDSAVFVIDSMDVARKNITQKNKNNIFNYKATSPDFVFALSNHYLWQVRSVIVDSLMMRKTSVTTAFNAKHRDYYEVNDFTAKTIQTMSFDFPGVPYPYSHITVIDGLDQMEYPMMINDNPTTSRFDAITLTTHEVFHQLFPFMIASNQTKYGFMDEGWATLGEWYISPLIDTTIVDDYGMYDINAHFGKDWDAPIITNTTELNRSMFLNSYPKPALAYRYLWDMLGDSLFKKALRHYLITWMDKSPTPWDFFNCMNNVSGQNLNWFWNAWFFRQGYPDLAINEVKPVTGGYRIKIFSKGNMPVPINLNILFDNGTLQKVHHTASVWKTSDVFEIFLETPLRIKKLTLGEVYDADINKSDNIYNAQ